MIIAASIVVCNIAENESTDVDGMAYYYYYQQHHTASPGPISPGTTTAELTPPPVILLSPQQRQQQFNLPLLTPILPSVTTSMPMTTTAMTSEQNQQQLPTPNTFIRHCDDIGLFHDLQNIVVMSSLSGSSGDIATTTVPVSTNVTMISSSASPEQPITSNVFGPSSTAIVTTMMMANPFDETFKQAVLQQQKSDTNSSEIIFHNNNNNDGDLNTPFIATTTAVDTSNNNKNSSLKMTSVDMTTTAEVAASTEVESLTTSSTTVPESHHQNLFISTSATEATAGTVLVMMVEQQQHNSIAPMQSQHHQQPFIVPKTTTTASVIDRTTMTSHFQDYYGNEGSDENGDIVINVESETTTIKKALKQNLLGKRLLQGKQKPLLVSKRHQEHGQLQQQNNDINVATNAVSHDNVASQEDDDDRKQKHKQEQLERNRSAAKRCRIKRKQRWELLSEENRRLKIENGRLRDALSKLVSQSCGGLQQQLQHQIHQQQASTIGTEDSDLDA